MKWATLGDENTKFFHVNAMIRHSKNCIGSLQDCNGIERVQHEEKALLLWESFKERLEQSEYSNMYFDLESIILPIDDLETLVLPFSNDKIDEVVRNLKPDKSLGSDGFNTDFMKKMLGCDKVQFL
jgi:hypothetical protein